MSSLPGQTDPEKEQHEQARLRAAANLRRLDRAEDDSGDTSEGEADGRRGPPLPRKEDLVLNQYESQIAMEVVAPEDIPVGFDGKSAAQPRLNTADRVQILEDWTISSRSLKNLLFTR